MSQRAVWLFILAIGVFGLFLIAIAGLHKPEPAAVVSAPVLVGGPLTVGTVANPPAVPTPAAEALRPTLRETEKGAAEMRAAANLAAPSHRMGEEFSVGYFSYIVHRTEVTSDPSDPAHMPVLAVFVNVRNDDNSNSTTPEFRLLDATGHDIAGAILETNSSNLLTEMKPGVVNRGYLLFEKVPVDGKYILLVSGGLISGQSAIVPLSVGVP
jgi:hypothetical protein